MGSVMKINQKQIEAVSALSGIDRYKHFVKVVADWQKAWGLYDNGWALAATDEGTPVFLFWPAEEYATLCAKEEWGSYKPRAIELEDLMNTLLPKLRKDGVLPGIFFTPSGRGVTPSVDELLGALKDELQNY